MQVNTLYKTLGLAFGALLLTACASKGDVNSGDASIDENANSQGVEGAGVSGESVQSADAALLEQTVFYFDFDQSSLKEESKEALKAHAAYLANNAQARVVLEGHADERGTVEYNLALGERRAMTVRSFLMSNGAQADQLKVVSFGEERPAVQGHDESAYGQNRRVEVKYQSR